MIHPTAEVSADASVGPGTRIWAYTHVREHARIGANCIVGEHVYVDADVQIGNQVKIQNAALLYRRLILEDGVFVGPQVCFTNDLRPRGVTPDGALKGADDWQAGLTRVGRGASLGARSTILPGLTIGAWAMVGAGAVVVRDVPDYGLVLGTPARLVGWVCPCGERLVPRPGEGSRPWRCPRDGWERRLDGP